MSLRTSQPVVLTSVNKRLQSQDMIDLLYMRHKKNQTELYSKARVSLDEDGDDSQNARITSPLTGSINQSGNLIKNTSMTTHHLKQPSSSADTEALKKSS